MATTTTSSDHPAGFVRRDRQMMATLRERCRGKPLALAWYLFLQDACPHCGMMRARQVVGPKLKARFCDEMGAKLSSVERAHRFLCRPPAEGGAGLLRIVRAGRRGRPMMVECLVYPTAAPRALRTGRQVRQEQPPQEQPVQQQLAAAVGAGRCPAPDAGHAPVSLHVVQGNAPTIQPRRGQLEAVSGPSRPVGKERSERRILPPPTPPTPSPSAPTEALDSRVEGILKGVGAEDLKQPERVEALAEQLIQAGHLPDDHPSRVALQAAAVAALGPGIRLPGRFFSVVVSRRSFAQLDPRTMEAARHRLARLHGRGQYAPAPDLPDLDDDDRRQNLAAMERAAMDLGFTTADRQQERPKQREPHDLEQQLQQVEALMRNTSPADQPEMFEGLKRRARELRRQITETQTAILA